MANNNIRKDLPIQSILGHITDMTKALEGLESVLGNVSGSVSGVAGGGVDKLRDTIKGLEQTIQKNTTRAEKATQSIAGSGSFTPAQMDQVKRAESAEQDVTKAKLIGREQAPEPKLNNAEKRQLVKKYEFVANEMGKPPEKRRIETSMGMIVSKEGARVPKAMQGEIMPEDRFFNLQRAYSEAGQGSQAVGGSGRRGNDVTVTGNDVYVYGKNIQGDRPTTPDKQVLGPDKSMYGPHQQIADMTREASDTRKVSDEAKKRAFENVRSQEITPDFTSQQRMFQTTTGYDMGDLPKAVMSHRTSGKNISELDKTIGKLRTSLEDMGDEESKQNQDVINAMTDLRGSVVDSRDGFGKALSEFREVQNKDKNDPQRIEREKKLVQAIEKLEGALDRSRRATEDAAALAGGGGGGPGGGGMRAMAGKFLGKLAPWLQGASAIAGMGFAGAQAYMGAAQTLDKQVFEGELRANQAAASVAQTAFRTRMDSVDMTRAENMIRFRGEQIFGAENVKYLGREGMGRAIQTGFEMEEMLRGMQRRQRTMGTLRGVGQIGAGGAEMLLGTGGVLEGRGKINLNTLLGSHMFMQGGGRAFQGLENITQATLGNQYTAFEGLDDSLLAKGVGYFSLGDKRDKQFSEAQRRELLQSLQRGQQRAVQLVEAEMRQRQPEIKGLQEILDIEQGEIQAASMVGAGRLTAKDISGYLSRQEKIRDEKIEADLNISETRRSEEYKRISKQYGVSEEQIEGIRHGVELTDRYNQEKARVEKQIKTERIRENLEKQKASDTGVMDTVGDVVGGITGSARRSVGWWTSKALGAVNPFATSDDYYRKFFESGDEARSRASRERIASLSPTQRMRMKRERDFFARDPGPMELYRLYPSLADETRKASLVGDLPAEWLGGPPPGEPQMSMVRPETKPGAPMSKELTPREMWNFREIANAAAKADAAKAADMAANQENREAEAEARRRYLNTEISKSMMSPKEFVVAEAQLASALDIETSDKSLEAIDERIKRAGSLAQMGLAGFGTREQLLGNLTGISRVAGGRDENMQRLREVLTSAVAAGFDGSRMSQQFVQSTLKISDTLRLTDVGRTAQEAGVAARMLSAGGLGTKADEFSLGLATEGMMRVGQITGQTGGYVGGQKFLSLFAQNVGIGGGGALMQSMNYHQVDDFISQLDKGSDARDINELEKNIVDPKYRAIIRERSRVTGVKDPKKLIEMITKEMRGVQAGGAEAIERGLNLVGRRSGFDFDKSVDRVTKSKDWSVEGFVEQMKDEQARVMNLGILTPGGAEGASTHYLSEVMKNLSPEQREKLKEKYGGDFEKKIARTIDMGQKRKNLRAYIDNMSKDMGKQVFDQPSMSDYKKYIKEGGSAFEVGGVTLDEEKLKELEGKGAAGEKEFQRLAKKGGFDRMDILEAAQREVQTGVEQQRFVLSSLDAAAVNQFKDSMTQAIRDSRDPNEKKGKNNFNISGGD